jgi:hypothetical protein
LSHVDTRQAMRIWRDAETKPRGPQVLAKSSVSGGMITIWKTSVLRDDSMMQGDSPQVLMSRPVAAWQLDPHQDVGGSHTIIWHVSGKSVPARTAIRDIDITVSSAQVWRHDASW